MMRKESDAHRQLKRPHLKKPWPVASKVSMHIFAADRTAIVFRAQSAPWVALKVTQAQTHALQDAAEEGFKFILGGSIIGAQSLGEVTAHPFGFWVQKPCHFCPSSCMLNFARMGARLETV